MDNATMQIIEKGISCLCEHLGVIEMETFISAIQRERFDYTKWHQHYVDNISEEELLKAIEDNNKTHPFNGKKAVIL